MTDLYLTITPIVGNRLEKSWGQKERVLFQSLGVEHYFSSFLSFLAAVPAMLKPGPIIAFKRKSLKTF